MTNFFKIDSFAGFQFKLADSAGLAFKRDKEAFYLEKIHEAFRDMSEFQLELIELNAVDGNGKVQSLLINQTRTRQGYGGSRTYVLNENDWITEHGTNGMFYSLMTPEHAQEFISESMKKFEEMQKSLEVVKAV